MQTTMERAPLGAPYSEYEFLARQSAELPHYRQLKQAERSGSLRDRTSAVVADLAIILDRTDELCSGNESAQDPDAGDQPRRKPSKAARRQAAAAALAPFDPYDETDPQVERLEQLFAEEYDDETKWAACQNDDLQHLVDRAADRGSLYAPFVTQSTIAGVGLGLFAGSNLPLKAFVTRYEGELVPTERVHTPEYKSAYAARVSDAWSVDARAYPWTPGRYINHALVKNRNVEFSVHPATNSIKVLTTKNVARGAELYLNYGRKYWKNNQAPESDENTIYLQPRFLDYYYTKPPPTGEQTERLEEADQSADWQQMPTPEDSPAPVPARKPAPAPAPINQPLRYWTPRPMPDAQFLAAALAHSRTRRPDPGGVCYVGSWADAAMWPITATLDDMALMRWNENSCFADALILAMFVQSYAFDPVLSVPSDSEHPVARASEALKRPLRQLIKTLRTKTADKFINNNLVGELRREFINQDYLPLPIKRTYGRFGDRCSFGAPEQLLATLTERPALSPLDDSVLPVSWTLLPEVQRPDGIVDRYPSMIVGLSEVRRSLGEAVVNAWTRDGRYRLLSTPHAFVVHYEREAYHSRTFSVTREPLIAGRQYRLRSIVLFRGAAHYAAMVCDPRSGQWHLLDPADERTPKRKLDPKYNAAMFDRIGTYLDIDLPLDASLLLYEAADFAAASRQQLPPIPGATLEALFGSGVERVLRQAREMYRTNRLRTDPPLLQLLPPRAAPGDDLAATGPPFPASTELSPVELLALTIASAGEVWDYAIASAPGFVRRVEQNGMLMTEGTPGTPDRKVADAWYDHQLFALKHSPDDFNRTANYVDFDKERSDLVTHIVTRNLFFDQVIGPPRSSNRYPGVVRVPTPPPATLSEGARATVRLFLGARIDTAEERLTGVDRSGPIWMPRECTLRNRAGVAIRLALRDASSDGFERALQLFDIGNLPAAFVAHFEGRDAATLAASVSLRVDQARCYDLEGLAPTYTLVGAVLERGADAALVHRQCGLDGYWVRRPRVAPFYAADLAEALRDFSAESGYRPVTLVYQNSAFDAPPAFY